MLITAGCFIVLQHFSYGPVLWMVKRSPKLLTCTILTYKIRKWHEETMKPPSCGYWRSMNRGPWFGFKLIIFKATEMGSTERGMGANKYKH